jgi:hypothetical protein
MADFAGLSFLPYCASSAQDGRLSWKLRVVVGCDRAIFEGQCEYVWPGFVEGCFGNWGVADPGLETRWLSAEVVGLDVDDWRAFAGREEEVVVR